MRESTEKNRKIFQVFWLDWNNKSDCFH